MLSTVYRQKLNSVRATKSGSSRGGLWISSAPVEACCLFTQLCCSPLVSSNFRDNHKEILFFMLITCLFFVIVAMFNGSFNHINRVPVGYFYFSHLLSGWLSNSEKLYVDLWQNHFLWSSKLLKGYICNITDRNEYIIMNLALWIDE